MNKSRVLASIRQGCTDPFHAARYHGGGKGGSDTTGLQLILAQQAAEKQAEASKGLVEGQTWANRPTLNTPWGNQTWQTEKAIDPATGNPVTQWTSNIKLAPQQQKSLDDQMRIQAGRSTGAGTLLNQSVKSFQTPFQWGSMPERPGSMNDAAADAYARTRFLRAPEVQERENAQRARMFAFGMDPNSEAAGTMERRLADQTYREQVGDIQSAFGEGRAQGGFQQNLRQAAIAEEALRRGMPLNELNALLTGQQVNMPQMPQFQSASLPQTPNYLGAVQGVNWGQPQQGQGMPWGDIASTAGTAAMMFAMSDIRLKTNVRRVGTHPLGVGVYEYTLFGRRERGVMAQELMEVAPELVAMHPSGYLMVNYGEL